MAWVPEVPQASHTQHLSEVSHHALPCRAQSCADGWAPGAGRQRRLEVSSIPGGRPQPLRPIHQPPCRCCPTPSPVTWSELCTVAAVCLAWRGHCSLTPTSPAGVSSPSAPHSLEALTFTQSHSSIIPSQELALSDCTLGKDSSVSRPGVSPNALMFYSFVFSFVF